MFSFDHKRTTLSNLSLFVKLFLIRNLIPQTESKSRRQLTAGSQQSVWCHHVPGCGRGCQLVGYDM